MKSAIPKFDLERYLPYRLTVIAGRLSTDLAKQYKSKFGISVPEWRVLLNVGYAKGLSVRDIEKRVSLEKSKVSRAASKLEAKGYLTKHTGDNDKRLVKLTLTEDGINLLNELVPIAQDFQAQLEEILGEKVEGLHAALDHLAAHKE